MNKNTSVIVAGVLLVLLAAVGFYLDLRVGSPTGGAVTQSTCKDLDPINSVIAKSYVVLNANTWVYDRCAITNGAVSNRIVEETTCNNGQLQYVRKSCPDKFLCADGVCVDSN